MVKKDYIHCKNVFQIIFLIDKTLETVCIEKCAVQSVGDLLDVLEDSMFLDDALTVLEHALEHIGHFPEYKDKSFGEVIRSHRLGWNYFGCLNIIGREQEIDDTMKDLADPKCKGIF